MARKIVITSGKGGVGKTTVCANLGVKLANLGFRVLLVDTDIGLNNLDVVMGVENNIMFDILDVIEGRCRPRQALIQDNRYPSLFVLASASSDFHGKITTQSIRHVLEKVENNFDYILIDCPAGVDNGFVRSVSSAKEALVVVTPHISSLRDADKVITRLNSFEIETTRLIINRVRGDMLISGEMISIEKIAKVLGIKILGVIPDDDALGALSSLGAFSYGTSGARAFQILAENLHNGSKKIYDCTQKYRGLTGLIRRNLKRRV